MNDIGKRARELLAAEFERDGATIVAEHVRGNLLGHEWPTYAIRAIIAALTLREGELLAGGAVDLRDQQHSGVIAAQVLDVVPAAALGANEAGAVGIGGQGDQSVGIELAEVAPEHEVGVPGGGETAMTASLRPPEGYVSEKPVLAAATRLRRLASGASPSVRKAYIKAAEMVEMAVSVARPEVANG